MSTTAIGGLTDLSSVESLFNTVFQGTGSINNSSGTAATSTTQISDNSQLSPFASLVSTLQTMQQNNPSEYTEVTQQIATNLNTAAQSAEASGNTTLANQLSGLATDFKDASSTGQLPNLQDLANAIGGHHHHHGHGGSADSSSNTSSTSSSNSSTDTASSVSGDSSSALQQLFTSLQNAATQNQSQPLNPLAIITNTLSNAGVAISNS